MSRRTTENLKEPQNIRRTEAGQALLQEIKARALQADEILLEEAGGTAEEKARLLLLLRKRTDRQLDSEEEPEIEEKGLDDE